MAYIVAAVVVVGAVAALNLLLTLGVIRRLREHSERLAGMTAGGRLQPPVDLILPAGERPGEFRSETVDGEQISLTSLATPALLGFFSSNCPPCKEWIPQFARAAARMPHGRSQALAVVVAEAAESNAEVAELREVAKVVVERVDGPVSRAFAVKGWPVLCLLGEDGTIITIDNHAAVAASATA